MATAIRRRWECPGCGKPFMVPAGKQAPERCPQCIRTANEQTVQLAAEPERNVWRPIDPLQALTQIAADDAPLPARAQRDFVSHLARIIDTGVTFAKRGMRSFGEATLLIFCVIVALACWKNTPPSLWRLAANVAVFFVGIIVVGQAAIRIPRWTKAVKLSAWIVVPALLWAYNATASYEERWKNKNDWTVVDTRAWWGSRVLYRRAWPPGNPFFGIEGGFSESGQPHGKWMKGRGAAEPDDVEWYWYGEKVTEGEWHLRNK